MFRKNQLFVLFGLLISFSTFAQDFYYKDYNVDIQVKKDGALVVTETLDTYFNEDRRGIFRTIPIIYKLQALPKGEEKAFRPLMGETYQLIMKDVSVSNDPFVVFDEGGYRKIRIGSPTKYLRGDKQYVIKYTVYGALNEFEDRVELVWNVIGNEHETYMNDASFSISFDDDLGFDNEDVVVVGGRRGKTKDLANVERKPGHISGESKRKLQAGEGITVGISIPKDYFDRIYIHPRDLCRNYYVQKHDLKAEILSNGRIRVEEVFDVDFVQPTSSFHRTFYPSVEPLEGRTQFTYIEEEFVESDAGKITYSIVRGGTNPGIVISPERGIFNKPTQFKLTYDIAGAIYKSDNVHGFLFDIINYAGEEPLEKSTFSIKTGQVGNFNPSTVKFSSAGRDQNRIDVDVSNDEIRGTISWDARHLTDLAVRGKISSSSLNHKTLPPEVYYRDYLVDDYAVNIDLKNNGGLVVEESYALNYKYPSASAIFKPNLLHNYYPEDFEDGNGSGHFPGINLLNRKLKNLVKHSDVSDGYSRLKTSNSDLYQYVSQPGVDDASFQMAYETSDNLKSTSDGVFYAVKLANPGTEPVNRIHVTWDKEDFNEVKSAWIKNGDNHQELALNTDDGVLEADLSNLLFDAGEPVVLQFVAAPDPSFLPSFMEKFRAFIKYNIELVSSLCYILVLWLLWFIFGRDKRWKKSVAFEPPIGMTPAEAGYIWDGVIHKKDLVSLIYWWAADDYIEIEEIEKRGANDYKLYKMKDLAKDAQSFEHIIFNGLFEDGDVVKVSSTRDSLYTTMRRAHKDLKKFGKTYQFWVPGTRAFGNVLVVLGVFLFSVGLLMIAPSIDEKNYTYCVPFLMAGIFSIIFGYIMPKKSRMGTEVYHELLSFREFIQTSSVAELEEIYTKDSNYFNRTISFAIVMGLGKHWAVKFKDLMKEPPKYYRNYDPSRPWDTIIYTDWIMSGMHRMNRDFNYQMPSQSTGSSSWGGSGGSFGGGGFSSGGGFGGGGSSSW